MAVASGALLGLGIVYCVSLPQLHELESYRASSDTLLYDDEGRVFTSYSAEHRVLASSDEFPKILYDAIISIEDRGFEAHSGFNSCRLLSAIYHDVVAREDAQGASTLTMQLARSLFLTPEKTYKRKIREILLAIQIERHFTKQQIFTLYANQIYLGHGVYGFATGAEFYFDKKIGDLTLEEAALLAALPKAPNNYSPIRNPERALRRRNLVITSMYANQKISFDEMEAAKKQPIRMHIRERKDVLAPYFAEEVRQYLVRQYGDEAVLSGGMKVYTTLNTELQHAANDSVTEGLSAYARRHALQRHLQNVNSFGADAHTFMLPEWDSPLVPGRYLHGLVITVTPRSARVRFGRYTALISRDNLPGKINSIPQLLSAGDIVYIRIVSVDKSFRAHIELQEESAPEGALLAIDNASGEVKAMVGGRDFSRSQFNRATQALRQAGSSFKPYVYTAAVDRGATPEDVVIDAPITFMTASGVYNPHNYDQKFEGRITLRRALAESRNIPALMLADSLGLKDVIEYAHRFGISRPIPAYLPIALGAVDVTLWEQTSAFSAFPNRGLRAIPHCIRKVTDWDGHVLEEHYPEVQDVIGERTAGIMTSMLRDVVSAGTAVAARHLNAPVAGKTGTTNEFTDAWFIGFSPSLTCGVWIGFDDRKSLGSKETGAVAALPVWIDFMTAAIANRYDHQDFPRVPARVVLAKQAVN